MDLPKDTVHITVDGKKGDGNTQVKVTQPNGKEEVKDVIGRDFTGSAVNRPDTIYNRSTTATVVVEGKTDSDGTSITQVKPSVGVASNPEVRGSDFVEHPKAEAGADGPECPTQHS